MIEVGSCCIKASVRSLGGSDRKAGNQPVQADQKAKSTERHLRLVYSNPTPLPKEEDLISAVLKMLEASAFDMKDIGVTAKGSDVTLTGSVRGKKEVLRAGTAATSVRGVRVVHNELFGW